MARKIVDIGVEGNDGTGDSIREGFRKTNENFKEIYAVFGQEGTLAFLNLGDVEAGQLKNYSAIANQFPVVNNQGSGIKFKPLVGAAGLTITYPDDPADPNYNKIVLTQQRAVAELGSADAAGKFGNSVDGQGFVFGNIADPTQANVLNWNTAFDRHGQTVIGAEKFPVPLGFADNRYINKGTIPGEVADAMVGYLSVPAGATGDQVPQAAETVLKAGATMTGKLFLSDHPGDLAGAGNPIGLDDKQAATKYYVDTTAYSSKVNLYVSTSGDDSQRKTPVGKEGRAFAYAYASLVAACLKAEQLIDESPWETGPYRQLIAYGGAKYYSEITPGGIIIGGGLNGTTRIKFTNDSGSPVDQGIANNRDIIPGKLVVGRNSGARGFIVKYGTIDNTDYVDLRDVTGSFSVGENLFFDQAVKRLEISIFIESGNYYEDYPIRIPRNCSILGDEFRRTVIRPADRISKSPWAGTWFYRDLEFDNLAIAETNWGYHYLSDPTNKASTPKNNKDLDVFLCNDATIIRQISCQGHGGFMMVLDPNGQILTKSPYCQQSGCFSGSLNKQAFRGGQYVDGQAGSMPVTSVSTNSDKTEITVTDAFRIPQTPTAFFVKGKRYKIDTFTDNGLGYRGARELLIANKEFIVAETIAYINDVITPTFTYDAVKFSQAVGNIINAVAWDVVFDSNIQSILIAEEYYVRTKYTTFPSEKTQTLAALNYVKDSLVALLSTNATAAARASAKMDIILQILTSGVNDRNILDASSWTYLGTTITVTKSGGHGLGAGWSVKIVDATATTNAPNGIFNVASIVDANTFTYTVTNAPTGTAGGNIRFTSSPIPIRSIPNPPVDPQALPATTLGIQNSLALLIANRELIKAEYIAYIQTYYSDFLFGTIGVAGYIRDADRIVNAVIYDSIYGGTSQSVLVSNNFFDAEGKSTISTEVTQIYNALEWIRDVAKQVVTNTEITGLLQVSIRQARGTAGTLEIATLVEDNFNSVVTAIRFGADTLPAVSYPSIENVVTSLQSAKSLLDINSNNIRSNTISFINNKYLYDVAAAQRDIRFLVDDLAHDIVYTGDLKMVEHGLGYFVGDAKLVSDPERPRTLAILDYIKQLALAIVDNVSIPNPQLTKVGSLIIGQTYKINTAGSTIWTALGSADNLHNTVFTATATGTVNATQITVGRTYTIVSRGSPTNLTNYISIGSSSNAVGTSFIANAVGTGTGTVVQGTGDARLASGSDFYRRQFGISQTIQLISSGAGPSTIVPSLTWVNTNLVNAFQKLQDTKEVIQSAVITWINNNIASNVTNPNSIWYGFAYNSGTCSRDVGLVVDAVGYDMMFNSNFRSSKAGMAYYRGVASAAIVRDNQLSATIASFAYLKNYLLSTITSAAYGNTANTRVGDKMDVVISILTDGLSAVPAFVLPDPTGFDIDYSNARRLISDNKAFIVDEITSWIAAQIVGNITPFTTQFQYNSAKCAQDVGYIIDAIRYDLTYGGNLETLVAANAYFVGADTTLGTDQKDKTIAAYARLKEIIGKVAQAVQVLDKNTALIQTTAVSGGGASTSVAFAQARVQDIIKQINITAVDSKPQLEYLIGTTRTMVANTKPTGYVSAKNLLVANRAFIQAEVFNYLKNTYTFTITQSTNNQFVTASTAKMRVGMPVKFLGTDPFQQTILSASTPLLVDGKYVVTFEFVRQRVRPDSTKEYEVQGNANGLYNLIVPVAVVPDQSTTDTTTTSITVVYPFNPGVFDYANQTTIRVSGGTFGGVNRDAKYYVKQVVSGTNFTISETISGGTPGSLFSVDSDTGTMYCSFAFDEATCRRDTGFLVSNISTDILYGGRYNTIKSGKRYLVASSVLVVTEQSVECRAGISYIDTLAQRIINNQAPLVNYQTLNNVNPNDFVAQVFDTNATGGSAAGATINGLVGLVNDIILNGKLWADSISNIPDAVVYPKYVLQLNQDTPYNTYLSGPLPDELVLQAAGNTSMLSNDWTQLNDLAYGLVATNNGLIETVSVFTYYCWTAYYSRNGGQIRSVAGSNAHGEYALVAEGSDPFEVPDAANLANDMPQVARIYKSGPFAAEMGKTKTTVYIDTYSYLPYNVSEIEINHGYTIVDGAITDIGITRYEVAGITDASGTYFSTAQPSAEAAALYGGNGKYRVKFTFPPKTYIPDVGRYYTITGNANTAYNNNLTGWLCVASDVNYVTLEFTSVNPGTFSTTTATTLKLKSGTILRLNLNTSGTNNTSSTGLQNELFDNQLVVIRPNQNFKFYNVDNISPTRPSTALTFRGDPLDNADAPVYRVLAFNTKDPLSNPMTLTYNTIERAYSSSNVITVGSTLSLRAGMKVSIVSGTGSLSESTTVVSITSDTTFTVSPAPAVALSNAIIQAVSPTQNDIILTFDSSYSYIGLVIDPDHNTLTEAQAGIDGGSTTRTLGSQIGDQYLSIRKINSAGELQRILTGQMCFAWNGRVHRISNYLVRTISSTEGYGIVQLNEVTADATRSYQDISGYGGTGIAAPTRPGEGYNISTAVYDSDAQLITYSITGLETAPNAARFTGVISATTLTVSNITSGTILVGSTITGITGTSVTAGTRITEQLTCSAASIYSSTATGISGAYTITLSVGSANILQGQFVSGNAATIAGLPTNTYVTNISGTTITLSNALTSNISATVYFFTAGLAGTYSVNNLYPAPVSSQLMGVHYTVYGNSNISYNIAGPILTSTYQSLTIAAAKATVVGSVSGLFLTVNYVSGNTIQLGQNISGTGLSAGTYVVAQSSGTPGGVGVYQLNTVASILTPTFTASINNGSGSAGTILNVSTVDSGTILVGADIQKTGGTGVTTGTTITGQLTGVTVATTTATGTSGTNILSVASVVGIVVGQLVTGTGVPNDTYVKEINITGIQLVGSNGATRVLTQAATGGSYVFATAGGQGTYSVDVSQLVTSGEMKALFIAIPGIFGPTSATRIFPTEKLYNPALVQDNTITLRTGLSAGEPADIIINISTCRVTGHDFSDIGTGGYNQTNYPNKVYGVGKAKNQKKEVAERGTGRVFWVATDQDGFFRVGRFFTVDQGTGTVTFAASLALSNLDGLGFKRGRAISEFSDDDTFQDLSDTKVPTEHAIDGYINRRLGIDRNNVIISEGTLGAGFLDRNGILEMNANLRLGGHYVENLGEITSTTPFNYAVTKRYVDNQQMSDAFVDVDGKFNNDILIYNGDRSPPLTPAWVNAKSSSYNSQIYVELIADKEVDIRVKSETIVNSQIKEDANISQNKLDINVANEQRDQGVLLSGVQLSSGYVVATSDAPTGKSPHWLVKLSVSGTPTLLSSNIWYTVSGNSNLNYNGKFFCVSSSLRVGGANAYIILEYPEYPGVFGGTTTTVTPWETTITSQLNHGLVAGDNVLITGSMVASVSVVASGQINSRRLILTSQNSGVGTGQLVTGTNIPDNTYVASVDGSSVTLTEKLIGVVDAATVTFASNINGNWLVKSVPATNSFVISLDTRLSGAFTLTTARATKLGLSTFNKNQFAVTNGFVSLKTSLTDAVTATINANSNIVTISNSDMAKIGVGHVITIRSGGSNVIVPTTALANPTGIDNGVQPQPMTVTAITSDTTFTVSVAFGGTGSAASAILNIISGVPLSSVQQIETDRIIGNLSGSRTTPNTVTTGQIVKAGDGIKNIQFNDDQLADVAVRGIMSIITRDTEYPHKNTYGVWNVTKTGAGNSVVRTTNEGAIEATQYILDSKKAIDTSGGANIDFFTPGQAKFLTASGNSGVAAQPNISVGTFTTSINTTATRNDSGLITVRDTANMYIGQEIAISGTPFGGLTVGTYYIVSINGLTNQITLSTSDTLSPVFSGTTGVAPSGQAMTVAGTTINPGVLNGQVYVPNLKAYGNVIFNPINANISFQPRSTNGSSGTITMYPAVNGSINNMSIGSSSESTGKFTTVEITSTTDAVNSTTGPLKVAGGASIAKKLFVGGNFEVTGDTLLTGNLVVKGVTTTVNSNTVNIADKNIILAGVSTSPKISGDIDASGIVTNMLAENALAITGLIPGMVITKDGTTGPTNNAVLGGFLSVATIAEVFSATSIRITLSTGSITAGKIIFTAAGGNDTTGDGGGITVKAAVDKTLIWVAATNKWTTNVGIDVPDVTVTNGFSADTVSVKTLTAKDTITLGDSTNEFGNTDNITTNAYFVAGNQLKTAKTTGNTLSVSAYDVDGLAYQDLIKLTAGNTPFVTIKSDGLGTLDGIDIGQTSHKQGKFTILETTDTATFGAAVTMTAANKNVTFSPSGTGTVKLEPAAALSLKSTTAAVTISSYTAGNMDGIIIGANTAKDGTFVNLTATTAVTFSRNGQGTSTTDATHTLKVTGGAGFSGNVYAAKFYGAFEVPAGSGTIKGQIDGADKVLTVTASDGVGPYYLTFADSNNAIATNETIYTDGSLSYNASSNTLTADNFAGIATKATNLTGGILGSIHYQSANNTSAILAPNVTITNKFLRSVGDGASGTAPSWIQLASTDISDFGTAVSGYIGTGTEIAGNAATASKWKTARTISFTGGATGSVSIQGDANVTCQLTLAAAAADTVKVTDEATASTARYITFTSQGTSGQQANIGIDGDLFYKPSTNTLTASYFAGIASYANYGDLAEKYLADADYEEGTVLVFGGDEEVTQSTVFNDRRVAGVISLKAAYTMNDKLEGNHVAVVALQGRVPVKVIGRVQKGDLLVSSGKPGYAIVNNDPRVGTVIGKSIAVKTTDGEGVVEAVVGKH